MSSPENDGLFTQNLTGTRTGNGTGNNIMMKFSHCKGTGTRTRNGNIIECTCYCTRKGIKWLRHPLVPFFLVPVPVSVPLQCENFSTIYSKPLVLVAVPFLFLFLTRWLGGEDSHIQHTLTRVFMMSIGDSGYSKLFQKRSSLLVVYSVVVETLKNNSPWCQSNFP